MSSSEKDYLVWLLKEMQRRGNPWNDELNYAVNLIKNKEEEEGTI